MISIGVHGFMREQRRSVTVRESLNSRVPFLNQVIRKVEKSGQRDNISMIESSQRTMNAFFAIA